MLGGAWLGTGTWLLRELRETDPLCADRSVAAVRAYAGGDTGPLVRLAEDVLEESGGPLFDGCYSSVKPLLAKFERDGDG